VDLFSRDVACDITFRPHKGHTRGVVDIAGP
jgi:hypothetical protein